ncbi:histidine phosphatase family protein [Paracoccus rhizosphaerae]|uniref:Histidine phosphatase family protein n=1 Tax=Paracoccus rhizosphaerae TaxID=1133347 RepID=A0ABV6CTC5_9RHOB|nr:histidine phosphatase family protein [Paracoccus rhizosphaerae]
MPDFPDLWLMRHGETVWNRDGRLHGGLDAPLTALGKRQAGWQADLVCGCLSERFSSPQGRAIETARRVFGGQGFALDADLSEVGIGSFAGRLLDDLRREAPAAFEGPPLSWYDRCPGGEGLHALERRCRGFLERLDGPALIVTHGITLRMLRLLALGQSRERLAEGDMRQGVVYRISGGACAVLRHHEDPR